jgi:hypothetical protein
LVAHAVRYQFPINMPECVVAQPNDDGREKLERFELTCIEALNSTEDESERQV